MTAEVCDLYMRLQHMAAVGSQDAGKYLGYAEWRFFLETVEWNRLSYCYYFGMGERLSQYIGFATPKPRRRQLRHRN